MHYCPHGITPSCQIQQHKTGKLFRGRSLVVSGERLKGKIGVMPQPARIELLTWLKSRY